MDQDRQMHLLRITAAVSFLLALVNHVLPPKAFAATQLLFDYSEGLTRRGLVGAALTLLPGDKVSVGEIYAVAALVSLAGAGAFYLFLKRTMPEQRAPLLLIILALNSFAYSSFIGNTGYLDGVLMVLTLLALSSNGARGMGLALRLGLTVLGVMVHENMLPYFTLLIGFDLFLARRAQKGALAISLLPATFGLLTLATLLFIGRMSPDQAGAFAAHVQARAGFGVDPSATKVAGRGIAQNFALMADLRGTTKYWAWVLFDGVPLALMSGWLFWLARRLLGAANRDLAVFYLGLVLLAPLSLNIIAFDVVRFGAASVLGGFIAIALILRHIPEAASRLTDTLSWPHFLLLLVLNANIFTIEVNIGAGHTSQFPWVLLTQLKWFAQ